MAGTWRWRNNAFWQQFPPSFGCDDSRLLDACQAANLLWFVALPSVASLTAVGLVALSSCQDGPANTAKGTHPTSVLGGRCSFQLSPQRFWSWWCVGFTGTDAAVVGVWLSINVAWAVAVMGRYQKLVG